MVGSARSNFRESQARCPGVSPLPPLERRIKEPNRTTARRSGEPTKTKNEPTNHIHPNMATNIKPLGTRVLVKRIEAEEQKTDGGIFLPDTAKEKPQEAEVLALGNGKNDEGETVEFSVAVGDKVLISKYGGTEVKINGEECLILNESDILGVLVD